MSEILSSIIASSQLLSAVGSPGLSKMQIGPLILRKKIYPIFHLTTLSTITGSGLEARLVWTPGRLWRTLDLSIPDFLHLVPLFHIRFRVPLFHFRFEATLNIRRCIQRFRLDLQNKMITSVQKRFFQRLTMPDLVFFPGCAFRQREAFLQAKSS